MPGSQASSEVLGQASGFGPGLLPSPAPPLTLQWPLGARGGQLALPKWKQIPFFLKPASVRSLGLASEEAEGAPGKQNRSHQAFLAHGAGFFRNKQDLGPGGGLASWGAPCALQSVGSAGGERRSQEGTKTWQWCQVAAWGPAAWGIRIRGSGATARSRARLDTEREKMRVQHGPPPSFL